MASFILSWKVVEAWSRMLEQLLKHKVRQCSEFCKCLFKCAHVHPLKSATCSVWGILSLVGSVQVWYTSFCVRAVVPDMSAKLPGIFLCAYVSTFAVVGSRAFLNIYKILSIATLYALITVVWCCFLEYWYVCYYPDLLSLASTHEHVMLKHAVIGCQTWLVIEHLMLSRP